jgi:hypothetical protein
MFERSTKKKKFYLLSWLENLDGFKEARWPNLCTGSTLSKKVVTWFGSPFWFGQNDEPLD